MISDRFDKQIMERYHTIRGEELEQYENSMTQETVDQILQLIAAYTSSKVVLAEQEEKQEYQQINKDNQFLEIKKRYMEQEGMKSTEAKEHANKELTHLTIEITETGKQIALLKAHIHTIEKLLKLQYTILQSEILTGGQKT